MGKGDAGGDCEGEGGRGDVGGEEENEFPFVILSEKMTIHNC